MSRHPHNLLVCESLPANVHLECTGRVQLVAAAGENKRPTFEILAYTGGAMRTDSFYQPVVLDLRGIKANGNIPVLLEHDRSAIVGQATKTRISRTDINVSGTITGDSGAAQLVLEHARNGFEWPASVGVAMDQVESLAENGTAKVNGQEISGPAYIVRSGRLVEVSFVAVAADPNAAAKIAARLRSTLQGVEPMNFSEWLKAKGFDEASLTADQLATLKAAHEAELKASAPADDQPPEKPADKPDDDTDDDSSEPETPADVLQARAAQARETRRVAAIRKLCASGKHPELEASAIEQGWSIEKLELEWLRAERPKATAVLTGSAPIASTDLLIAAACQAGKLPRLDKHFGEPILSAAHRAYRGRVGIQELLMEAAAANGWSGRTFRADPHGILRAAFSTMDITNILSNVANKFLLEGFNAIESTWRAIASVRPVNDFKTQTSLRLTGGFEYVEVGPTGELEHATAGEEVYTNQARTYGILFSITRQDLVNDDLGALTQVPNRIGRGAALKLNTVFWTKFLDNGSFFTSGRGNYSSGAGTALSLDALTAAELLFLNQTDPNSKPLGIVPTILLVPNAKFVVANQLMNATEIRDTTASTKYPTQNPHAGKWRVERSSYLSNAGISGYSATAWYLLADPAALSTIEVAFLDGNESPTVENADAQFNVLGIQMRGYHDFGVSQIEYRGGVKMAGA